MIANIQVIQTTLWRCGREGTTAAVLGRGMLMNKPQCKYGTFNQFAHARTESGPLLIGHGGEIYLGKWG